MDVDCGVPGGGDDEGVLGTVDDGADAVVVCAQDGLGTGGDVDPNVSHISTRNFLLLLRSVT